MGFLLSIAIAAIYLQRLFTVGLPSPDTRPGMMIAVGPPCYAPLAWLETPSAVPDDYGLVAQFPMAATIIKVMALMMAISTLGLALFFFIMAFCAIARHSSRMRFHLTWYGFIFPNVGTVNFKRSCSGLS